MGNTEILLVEDDESLGYVTTDNLQSAGYSVTWVKDGAEVIPIFRSNTFDAVILDVMLPGVDGFTLAETLRKENAEIPLLFLSARSMLEDRLQGLKKGADDYLTKPFSMEELILKLEVFIKRSKSQGKQKESYSLGNYTFMPNDLKLQSREGDKILTAKEAAVLRMLCEHVDSVLKREDILTEVWGNDDYFLGRSLDVFISKLRKHLKDESRVSIVNYHGVGFRLEIDDK